MSDLTPHDTTPDQRYLASRGYASPGNSGKYFQTPTLSPAASPGEDATSPSDAPTTTIEVYAAQVVDNIKNVPGPSLSKYAIKGRKGFLPGHGGRPKGAVNKRRQSALELMDAYGFDPLESKIVLTQAIEKKLIEGHFRTDYEELEYLKLYAECLKDLSQYGYQRLKSVEHFGQVELIQKLQELDSYTEEELKACLAEAQAYARQLQQGQ